MILSAAIFLLGLIGLFVRKDALTLLVCMGLLIMAVGVLWIAVAKSFGEMLGQGVVLAIIATAFVQGCVGVMLILKLQVHKPSLQVKQFTELKG
ncbi:MAG: NADH-quinone oxidoreductase subunit K [Bdellovibrionota bacterium]